jgi:SagB-type dehydrogenase family enzyme
MGCDSFAVGHFPDDEVARSCRLHADEWPMLIVRLFGKSIPVGGSGNTVPRWFGGVANRLSSFEVPYPRIEEIHAATKVNDRGLIATGEPPPSGSGDVRLPPAASSDRAFGEVVRRRRSALDFRGGNEEITLAQLSAILAVAAQPLSSDFGGARFIQLYLYAHRVEELERGVYRYWPEYGELESIRSGDQRVVAAGLSLGQDLAGNACVAFSMVADLERAARAHGNRGYRYAHFEAGAMGQRLYLGAEALGLGATGIGAFFDGEVHRYLSLDSSERQVVYHFAIGYPVPDPRLSA